MGTAKKKKKSAPKSPKPRTQRHRTSRYRLCCVCDELFFSDKVDSITCSNECLSRERLYAEAFERVAEKRACGELEVKHENTPSTSVMLTSISHLLNGGGKEG